MASAPQNQGRDRHDPPGLPPQSLLEVLARGLRDLETEVPGLLLHGLGRGVRNRRSLDQVVNIAQKWVHFSFLMTRRDNPRGVGRSSLADTT